MKNTYKVNEEAVKKIAERVYDNGSTVINRNDLEEMFPELKESNGERIRKALLEMVHDTTGDELWVDYNIHKEEAIAWLEKQGEQKPQRIVSAEAKEAMYDKPAWSEEDEVKINRIVACLENLNVADNDILLKDINWLKSLKARVQPQQQEWSEEDEHNLNSVINLVHNTRDGAWGSCVGERIESWLKSLKERYTWKPSDEQMKALCNCIGKKWFDKGMLNMLKTLYNDLQNL